MDNIKTLIDGMPISVAELARKANVSVHTVNSFKNGEIVRRDNAVKILRALSDVYGRSISPFTLGNVTGVRVQGIFRR